MPSDSRTTTKKEIIERIADETKQYRTTVKRTIQRFLDTIVEELSAGNRLELRDFGVFEIRERQPRIAQNPRTMEQVPIPSRKAVKFKEGLLMKRALNSNGQDHQKNSTSKGTRNDRNGSQDSRR